MKKLVFLILAAFYSSLTYSQCVNCSGTGNTGWLSTTLGYSCIANNDAAFASGYQASATGKYSSSLGFQTVASGQRAVAIGYKTNALNITSIAIGSYVTSSNDNAFVIGTGLSVGVLNNNIYNSLMIGFNSIKPTIFVGPAPTVTNNDATGKVGIGNVTSPQAKLHIKADNGEAAVVFIQPYSWSLNSTASLWLGSSSNYLSAKLGEGLIFHVESGNYVFNNGYLKLTKDVRKDYVLTCTDSVGTAKWMPAPGGSQWLNSGTSDIYYSAGNVGIGTSNTGGYKLAVNGNIQAELVKIVANVPSSDYVFEKGYQLMPLPELEEFVNNNKHLPDVKSAAEFKEEGYNVGDMDDVLLRKVEELTLYTIDQQKQIDQQQQLMDLLIQQVIDLKQQLNKTDN